jgi:hypothetical protein
MRQQKTVTTIRLTKKPTSAVSFLIAANPPLYVVTH